MFMCEPQIFSRAIRFALSRARSAASRPVMSEMESITENSPLTDLTVVMFSFCAYVNNAVQKMISVEHIFFIRAYSFSTLNASFTKEEILSAFCLANSDSCIASCIARILALDAFSSFMT
jgi:hypothetical protein